MMRWFLALVLLASNGFAAPSAGPPQPPLATVASLLAGGCTTADDRVFRVLCTNSNCTVDGTLPFFVQCSGTAGIFNVIRADGSGGTPAFSGVTSGTNTAASMVVGSGSSIATSGTGTNSATGIVNQTAGEPGFRYDTGGAKAFYEDRDGSGSRSTSASNSTNRALSWTEQPIDGSFYGYAQLNRRLQCNPAAFEGNGSFPNTLGIQECVDALTDTGFGGTVILGPASYDLGNAVVISASPPILIKGAGIGSTNVTCKSANGCTDRAVFKITGSAHDTVFEDVLITGDRGTTSFVNGIENGTPDLADCKADGMAIATTPTLGGVPASCCTGNGTGTCPTNGDYISGTRLNRVQLNGAGAVGSPATFKFSAGFVNFGLRTTITSGLIKGFRDAVVLSGNSNGTSNVVTLTFSEFRYPGVDGVRATTGGYFTGLSDASKPSIHDNVFESLDQYGIEIAGSNITGEHQIWDVIANHFEHMDTGVHETGLSGGTAEDSNLLSVGNFYTVMSDGDAATCTAAYPTDTHPCCTAASTGPDCDANTTANAVIFDNNTDADITSINDYVNATNCISHAGTGTITYLNTGSCTPSATGTAVVVPMSSMALIQADATNCTDNTGNYKSFCEEQDDNTLYVCETTTGCVGSGWALVGAAAGGTAGAPLFVQTAAATDVTNTATETSILGTGTGSLTIPANWFTAAGTVLDVHASGKYSAVAAQTLTFKLKFGSTVIAQTAALTPLIVTDGVYSVWLRLVARTVGSGTSATVIITDIIPMTGATLTPAEAIFANPTLATAVGFNSTGSQTVDLTAQWGAANSGNHITGLSFEMVGPGSAVSSVNGSSGVVTVTSDAAYGGAWDTVTTVSPSKNAVYDHEHTADSDDDGKVDTLDQVTGICITNSSGVLQTPITTSTGLRAALSDPTGTGSAVFGTSPTLASPAFSGTATGNDTIPSALITTERKSAYWDAGSITADGTNCTTPTEQTLNSGIQTWAFSCADSNSSIFYGKTVMPDVWDAGNVGFQIAVFHGTTETITFAGDFSCQCHGDGEVLDNTWSSTPKDADVAITTANRVEMQTTSADVTCSGTCAGGDILLWRYVVDAANFSTNAANTKVLGVKMEYVWNVGD